MGYPGRHRQAHCLPVLIAFAVLCNWTGANAFRNGDFIQSARKSQFHAQRTHWHDLVGDSCPRFGRDRVVAVTLLKPVLPADIAQPQSDEYKVQFAYDGDRHMTQWLKLVGKGAHSVPVVHITLKRSGDTLLGVTGTVSEAPMHLQHNDPSYASQWRNATHWPKKLMVSYKWDTHNDVDLNKGLVVLLTVGLFALVVLAINASLGAGPKLAQFLTDIATELNTEVGPGPTAVVATTSSRGGPSGLTGLWKGGGKAE